MKKIIIIGPAHPLRGGIAAFNERLANALLEEGHQVHIETFKLQYPNFLFPGKTQYSDSPEPDNLNIDVTINSVNPFNWIKIGRKLKKMNADLAIVAFWLPFMGPCLGKICSIIKRNRKTKIVSLTHNLIPHEKRPGDGLFIRYFGKKADAFLAMSKSVLKDIETTFPSAKSSYSPHPLYDHYGKIESKEEACKKLNLSPLLNYLLFFGIVRDYKGLDLLLEALSFLDLEKLKLRLIVAGEFYSDPKPYLEQIAEHSLENFVILKQSFIPDNEVAWYFNTADLVVQPYKTATQSGVAQIGLHFNKSMMVTNVGGLGEIIPHNKAGYVVDKNPKEIANAIEDFFVKNKKLAFENQAAEIKKQFSWSKLTQNLLDL